MCEVALIAGGLLLGLLGPLLARSAAPDDVARRLHFPTWAIVLALALPLAGVVLAVTAC